MRSALAIALVAACFEPPAFDGTAFACRDSPECPAGYACVDERCELPGAGGFVHFAAIDFQRGCEADGGATCPADASPGGHPQVVHLGSFDIQTSEVTQAAYDTCVATAGCEPPEVPDYTPQQTPQLPVRGVTHANAARYCATLSLDGDGEPLRGRLPTEAEWECAAGECNGARAIYPWGASSPTCELANSAGCAGHVEAAHATGATPRGLRDLSGNVREWVADYYAAPYGGDLDDPRGPTSGTLRVVRGGGFRSAPTALRVWAREAQDPAARTDAEIGDIGIRCVADAP